MMNFQKHITFVVGLTLLSALCSCTSDEKLPDSCVYPEELRMPLRIAGAAVGSGLEIQTRATTELTSGSIGLFLKEDAGSGYEALNNLKYTYATPFWQTDEQILLGNSNAVLAAYYPYTSETTNPVLLRSRKYSDEDAKLCYVNLEANNTAAHLTLDLERMYSRIVFTLKGSGYPGNGEVSALRLSGTGITPVATLDLLERSVFADTGNHGVYNVRKPLLDFEEVEIKAETQFTNAVTGTVDCLLVPTKLTGNVTFTLTVDGITLSGKVAATSLCGNADGIQREGVQYEVNLTVQPVKLEVASISKTEWEPTEVEGDYEIN